MALGKESVQVTDGVFFQVSSYFSWDEWNSDQEATRLEQDGFPARCIEWLAGGVPDGVSRMGWVSISLLAVGKRIRSKWGGCNVARHGSFESEDIELVFETLVRDPPASPIGGRVLMIRAVEEGLRQVAPLLGVAGEPPRVEMRPDELEWIAAHGEPVVDLAAFKYRYVDGFLPMAPVARPKRKPRPFQVWRLFPANGVRNGVFDVDRFEARLDAMSEERCEDAMGAVRALIDHWCDIVGEGCRTDSSAMMAIDVMCRGQKVWERALLDPHAEWVFEGIDGAEAVLNASDWGID